MCTGNTCRSPMAKVLLRRHLDAAGVSVRVSSAGPLGGGQRADPRAVDVMAERGLDLSAHVSRLVDETASQEAHLIVGMARPHVRDVVTMNPGVWPRTFTLKELVRRARRAGPRPGHIDVPTWLLRVGEGRSTTDLLGVSTDDDIAAPSGSLPRHSVPQRSELDFLLAELVSLLWPSA